MLGKVLKMVLDFCQKTLDYITRADTPLPMGCLDVCPVSLCISHMHFLTCDNCSYTFATLHTRGN